MPGISFSTEDTLVSKQGIFELGFFCPGNTEKLFIGIMVYKHKAQNRGLDSKTTLFGLHSIILI